MLTLLFAEVVSSSSWYLDDRIEGVGDNFDLESTLTFITFRWLE